MKLRTKIFFIGTLLFNMQETICKYKIGLLTVATGKYINFIEPLINSAKKHFCANHEVHYFVFTDSDIHHASDITFIYQKKLGWPYDSMMRLEMYANNEE